MKSTYLFPHAYRKIGWILFLPGLLLGLLYLVQQPEYDFLSLPVFAVVGEAFMEKDALFSVIQNNIYDEITGVLLIVGALLVAFSKERSEDELIAKIRLESLVWATYINYAILLLAILFIYDISFFWVLVLNMFTILFFFIIRFNWALRQMKTQLSYEE